MRTTLIRYCIFFGLLASLGACSATNFHPISPDLEVAEPLHRAELADSTYRAQGN